MSKRSGRIPDDTRKAILAALRAGAGVCEAARQYGVGRASVSRVGAAAGLDLEQPRTKKAHEAASAYPLQRRLELGNKLFASVERLVGEGPDVRELHALVMSYAILTDKRRLEEGEVTERHARLAGSGGEG